MKGKEGKMDWQLGSKRMDGLSRHGTRTRKTDKRYTLIGVGSLVEQRGLKGNKKRSSLMNGQKDEGSAEEEKRIKGRTNWISGVKGRKEGKMKR